MKRSQITRALESSPNNLKLGALIASMPSAQSVASDRLDDIRRNTMTHGNLVGDSGSSTPFPVVTRSTRRIRFIYIGEHVAPETVATYHDLLVEAEVLLGRMFNAQAIGLRPLDLQLGAHHHQQIFSRPPRGVFTEISPEYRRWYTEHGSTRALPLTREALIAELGRLDGLTSEAAREAATSRSWALPKVSQDWLIARSEVEAMHRPLHRDDMEGLARILESILGPQTLPGHIERIVETNRQIAVRTAAALGSLLDTFAPPPFASPELAEAFAAAHAAHLARVASLANLLPVASAGSHWFLAKRHQIKAMVSRHAHSFVMAAELARKPPAHQPSYMDWCAGDEVHRAGAIRAPNR